MSSKRNEDHLELTRAALVARQHANELRLAAWAAEKNAEALETVVCEGTDADVKAALSAVSWARRNGGEA